MEQDKTIEAASDLAVIRMHVEKFAGNDGLKLCKPVFDSALFMVAPAASSHHHNYRHGLVKHTREVVDNCVYLSNHETIRMGELVIAATWHDFCKVYEYDIDYEDKISRTYYYLTMGHVVGSVMCFEKWAAQYIFNGIDVPAIERITHMMLAHHGRQEWGSPVSPRSKEAYLLHAADMISAQGIDL